MLDFTQSHAEYFSKFQCMFFLFPSITLFPYCMKTTFIFTSNQPDSFIVENIQPAYTGDP